jgi:hypothetical protein
MTARRARAAALGFLLATSALAGHALAQPTDAAAAAKAKFEQGQAAAEKGDLTRARSLFLSSKDLYPTVGTLLNLADCEERLGLLGSALGHYEDARALMKPGDKRASFADEHAAALRPRAPLLRIALAGDAPPGTRLSIDGAAVPEARASKDLPLDPGDHTITVAAPGRTERSYRIKLSERDRQTLAVDPGAAAGATDASAPTGTAAPTAGADTGAPRSGGALRTAGYVTGAAGLLGVAAGAVTGILALQKKGSLATLCPVPAQCGPEGQAVARDGKTFGTASTVGFAVGVPLAAAGALLVLLGGPKTPEVRAAVLPGGAAVEIGGRF